MSNIFMFSAKFAKQKFFLIFSIFKIQKCKSFIMIINSLSTIFGYIFKKTLFLTSDYFCNQILFTHSLINFNLFNDRLLIYSSFRRNNLHINFIHNMSYSFSTSNIFVRFTGCLSPIIKFLNSFLIKFNSINIIIT